jgi:hypothetical protein
MYHAIFEYLTFNNTNFIRVEDPFDDHLKRSFVTRCGLTEGRELADEGIRFLRCSKARLAVSVSVLIQLRTSYCKSCR